MVKHILTKIFKITAANYCGRQLAQRLGLVAPANHKTDGATPHPGVHKLSLQYDGRSDERLGMRVGTQNLGSLSGNGEKFVKN